jgi:hypothetical protein
MDDVHAKKPETNQNDGPPRALDFQGRYQSKVTALNYAIVVTRPDIVEVVGVVSRSRANPTEEHMKTFGDIYTYLKYTPNVGLHFKRNCADRELHAYVDADWPDVKTLDSLLPATLSNLQRAAYHGRPEDKGLWQCQTAKLNT